jgi:uncharacterized membrane protein YraQ (UPF0718 family)
VDQEAVKNFILFFTRIIYEALPFIVLGVVIAGLLEELLPQRFVVKFIPKNRFLAIAISGVLGLVFPMCECGIIVVMRRLLRKGVPLSCCVCYMLAGPIINVVVMLSTYAAFSGKDNIVLAGPMVALRVGLGFFVAFTTSLIVDWQYRKHGPALLSTRTLVEAAKGSAREQEAEAAEGPRTLRQRLSNITETALHDFVDIMVFLILGACLAALMRVLVSNEDLAEMPELPPAVAILLMMAFAVLLCLCSEADAFVAANAIGMPASAKLAFLVLGPMLDLKLFMMYTRVFRMRLIWTIIVSVVIQTFLLSMAAHYVAGYLGYEKFTTGKPPATVVKPKETGSAPKKP